MAKLPPELSARGVNIHRLCTGCWWRGRERVARWVLTQTKTAFGEMSGLHFPERDFWGAPVRQRECLLLNIYEPVSEVFR